MIAGRLVTRSEEETRSVAADLARTLGPGAILLLSGDLGVGKTAFVRGVAQGLGADPNDVSSPTFTIVHEYRGGLLPLIHVDLYRLESADLDEIGMDGDVAVRGVVAVEWPERLTRVIPQAVTIRMEDLGGDRRAIEVVGNDGLGWSTRSGS